MTQTFLQERDRANTNPDAILDLFHEYLDENRASMESWYELLAETILRHPEITHKLSLHSHGIDRFYDEESLFWGATLTQSQQNIVKGDAYDVVALKRDAANRVLGVKTQNGDLHTAKHIFLHPGAYMDPQVLAETEAHGKLAGVKGLWMRIKNAQNLLGQAPRPNKIHGGKYHVQQSDRTYTGQICDLNVMPKHNLDGSWELVIGSGYLFVGTHPFEGDSIMGQPLPEAIAEGDRQTQIQLAEELAIRAFAQVVSQVYDIEIDVDAVLAGTHDFIDLPSRGCIRSWTPDDRELRVMIPTAMGGILLIDGGGNTGSTTKAPFVSKTAISFTQSLDAEPINPELLDLQKLQARYEQIRTSLRRSKDDLPASAWQRLEDNLNEAIQATQSASCVLSCFERLFDQDREQNKT